MSASRIIHVEKIRHDPLLGRVSGVVIRRDENGDLIRQRVSAPVAKPNLPHAEADARLRRLATTF